jgi:hypothetical protein
MTGEEMREVLARDGYFVMKDVFEEKTCDALKDSCWDYLERMCPGVDRNDPSTRRDDTMPLNMKGLIQQHNIGFQPFSVDAHLMAKPLYEKFWGTDKLVCSFDGVSITENRKRAHYKSLADWKEKCWDKNEVHIDQTTPGFFSVQGGLAITDQEEDEHVFLCIPGSHHYHEDILRIGKECAERECAKQMDVWEAARAAEKPLTKIVKKKKKDGTIMEVQVEIPKPTVKEPELHWMVMNTEQLAFLKSKGLEMKRIPMKKGSFVFWDSRTVHASAPYCATARKDAMRIQIFIAMAPVLEDPEAVAEDRELRQKGYDEGRVSKHSAAMIRLFGKTPRQYNRDHGVLYKKMRIPRSLKMTREEKRLYGLKSYE